MARSKSSGPDTEPLFPNLKISGVNPIGTPKLQKDVTSTATPTAGAAPPSHDDHDLPPSYLENEPPPSYRGHDPDATPTGPTNPGNKPHDKWNPISVHTAKCDNCSKHNTSVIQRCTSCNFQLCRNCIGSVDDKIHIADAASLDWTPKVQSRGKRRSTAAARKPAPKTTAFTISSNNTVKKPAPRASTRIPRERLLAESEKQSALLDYDDEDTIHVEVPKSHLDDFEDVGSKRKRKYPSDDEYEDEDPKSERRRYAIDPEYVDDDEDTDEDKIVQQRVRFQQDQRRPRDPIDVRMVERTTAWQKIEDAAIDKSYGKGKGCVEPAEYSTSSVQRPHRYSAALGSAPASSSRLSQSGRKPDYSFDDAIAEAYEQRQNSKRKADERRLQAEQDAAWNNNLTIKKLLEEGKVEEAKEMMDIATELLMIERGLK